MIQIWCKVEVSTNDSKRLVGNMGILEQLYTRISSLWTLIQFRIQLLEVSLCFESQMEVAGKQKIFIFDNFNGHSWGRISHKLLITRCELLPPNTTSTFQPMDVNIINSCKAQFCKSCIQHKINHSMSVKIVDLSIDIYSPTSLYMTCLRNKKTVTYSIIWQINHLCHNNKVLHENTHEIFSHKYKINKHSLQMSFSWNLCGLEEGINSLLMLPLQFSNKYLIEFLWDGLQFHYVCKCNVANNWAWCWASTNFIIGGGLSSTSEESKGYALRSKIGGFILYPKAISTSSIMQYSTSMMSSPFIIILF